VTPPVVTSGSPAAGRRGRRRVDRASLALAVLLLVMGVTLAVDASSIQAPPGSDSIGPSAFPWAIAVALLALGCVLGAVALRGREPHPHDAAVGPLHEDVPHDDEPASGQPEVEAVPVGGDAPPALRVRPVLRVAVFAAGLVAHALLIDTAGYVVAALVLFVAVALAFGAPRPVRIVLVGLVLTLAIFYAFTLGLGLALPNLGGG
jgi:putative tricarboxylic transport membrane protein